MTVSSLRLIACALLLVAGCGKSAAGPDAPGGGGGDGLGRNPDDASASDGAPLDVPGHTPGMPGLGAHAIKWHKVGDDLQTSITTVMATQVSGSTVIVAVGRGDKTLFTDPTDNKGNSPYERLGIMHPYGDPFPESGTALYSFISAKGGADFQISTVTGIDHNSGNTEEITLATLEVIEGTRIDHVWNLVAQNNEQNVSVTSKSITTTGPATLIAFWFGDAFPRTPQSAIPNNDFVPIDTNAYDTDSFVQCAVAAKNVTAPGMYNVTWTSDPIQGAQLWLVAVQ